MMENATTNMLKLFVLIVKSHWRIQECWGCATPVISFILKQFSEKYLPNNRFVPPSGWRTSIWEILDMPL